MESKTSVNFDEMDNLCVCAIRYCQGRRTYMPSLIQKIVICYLDKLSDNAIETMLLDCEEQRRTGNYGDENDKADWIEFERILRKEKNKKNGVDV